jgi:hypothetical protein
MNWYADFFTISIPLTVLGSDDGFVNAAAIYKNQSGVTDCVPNKGFLPIYPFEVNLPLVAR